MTNCDAALTVIRAQPETAEREVGRLPDDRAAIEDFRVGVVALARACPRDAVPPGDGRDGNARGRGQLGKSGDRHFARLHPRAADPRPDRHVPGARPVPARAHVEQLRQRPVLERHRAVFGVLPGGQAQLVVHARDARIAPALGVLHAQRQRRSRDHAVVVHALAQRHGLRRGDRPGELVHLQRGQVQPRLHRRVPGGVVAPGPDRAVQPVALGHLQHAPERRLGVGMGKHAHRALERRLGQRLGQRCRAGRGVERRHLPGEHRAVGHRDVARPARGRAVRRGIGQPVHHDNARPERGGPERGGGAGGVRRPEAPGQRAQPRALVVGAVGVELVKRVEQVDDQQAPADDRHAPGIDEPRGQRAQPRALAVGAVGVELEQFIAAGVGDQQAPVDDRHAPGIGEPRGQRAQRRALAVGAVGVELEQFIAEGVGDQQAPRRRRRRAEPASRALAHRVRVRDPDGLARAHRGVVEPGGVPQRVGLGFLLDKQVTAHAVRLGSRRAVQRRHVALAPAVARDQGIVHDELYAELVAVVRVVEGHRHGAVAGPLLDGLAVAEFAVHDVGRTHQHDRIGGRVLERHDGAAAVVMRGPEVGQHAGDDAGRVGRRGDHAGEPEPRLGAAVAVVDELVVEARDRVQLPLGRFHPCGGDQVAESVTVVLQDVVHDPGAVVGPGGLEGAVPDSRVRARDGVVIDRHLHDAAEGLVFAAMHGAGILVRFGLDSDHRRVRVALADLDDFVQAHPVEIVLDLFRGRVRVGARHAHVVRRVALQRNPP